jgi:hypothetical protein
VQDFFQKAFKAKTSMTIILGDEEIVKSDAVVIAAASRGILQASLATDEIDAASSQRFIISIWISLLGLECLARGVILIKAASVSEESAAVVVGQREVIWSADSKRVAVVIDEEVFLLDLLFTDKKDGRNLSIAELIQLVGSAAGPRSRVDSPCVSEIVALKLQRRKKLSVEGLVCVSAYDSSRCLLLIDIRGKTHRIHWDGSPVQRRHPSDSLPSTPLQQPSSASATAAAMEHLLFYTWKSESFSMTPRSLHPPSFSMSSEMDASLMEERGRRVIYAAHSDQLRISALMHADGSLSIVRFLTAAGGYLSTNPIYPVVKHKSHQRSNVADVAGRVLALSLIDNRNLCGSSCSILTMIFRTRIFPEAVDTDVGHKESYVDHLLVAYVSCAAVNAAVELSVRSVHELGCISQPAVELSSLSSSIRSINAVSNTSGPVVLVHRSGSKMITGHAINAAGTSLFRIDLDPAVQLSCIWSNQQRFFFAASTPQLSNTIHAIAWKSSLKHDGQCAGQIFLDCNHEEWAIEFFRAASSSSSSATCMASYRPALRTRNPPTLEYLVREYCDQGCRLRVALPSQMRSELLTHDRKLLVAESSVGGPSSYGYITAIAEVGLAEALHAASENDGQSKTPQHQLAAQLWMHNKHTRRWRGTNMDIDAASLAVLIDNPLASSPIDAYAKQRAADAVFANRHAALKGSFQGAISLAWFENHSVVLLSVRKARCCLEVVSRDIGAKASSPQTSPRPALHHIYQLPAGTVPLQMNLTLIDPVAMPVTKKKSTLCPSALVTVLHESYIIVYQVTAIMKRLDAPSAALIDYAVNVLWEVSFDLLQGTALPLKKAIAVADGSIDQLAVYALDAQGKALAIESISIASDQDRENGNAKESVEEVAAQALPSSSHRFQARILASGVFVDLQCEKLGSDPHRRGAVSQSIAASSSAGQNSALNDESPSASRELSVLVLVAVDSPRSMTAPPSSNSSGIAYIPRLRLSVSLPAVPQLSSYAGIQSNALFYLSEANSRARDASVSMLQRSSSDCSLEDAQDELMNQGSARNALSMMQSATLGSFRHRLASADPSLVVPQRMLSPITLHEISLPVHIFIGVVDHLIVAIEANRTPKENHSDALHLSAAARQIDLILRYLQNLLSSLTLKKGRQFFAEDLEQHILSLARSDHFKNTSSEYRAMACIMHASSASTLLTQILTRVARRIEIHQAQRLFPVPCSLNLLLGRSTRPHEVRSLTPLSLFLSCIQPTVVDAVGSSSETAAAHAQVLTCAARLLTFACEYEGGTESYRSTERCVSMALEVLQESTRALALHLTIHCLDFVCRLEDALAAYPASASLEEYPAYDLVDGDGRLQVSAAWSLTACNERLWRDSGVYSTLGMVSPTLSYLVGGSAMWMMGRTLGVVAAAVTAEGSNSNGHSNGHGSADQRSAASSSALRFNCYVQCSRFLAAARIASNQGQPAASPPNACTLTIAFIALTCADFLKDQRFLACALFCAAITTRCDLARARLRPYLLQEASRYAAQLDLPVDVDEESLRPDEEMSAAIHRAFSHDIERSVASSRAYCSKEAEREIFIHFDLPDLLRQNLDSQQFPSNHHPVRLPLALRKGLALGLLIAGKYSLSLAIADAEIDGRSPHAMIAWLLD